MKHEDIAGARRIARTSAEAFRDAEYGNTIELNDGTTTGPYFARHVYIIGRKSIAWPLVCFASFAFIGVLLAW